MRDEFYLGVTPSDEDCVQLGWGKCSGDWDEAMEEAKRYASMIKNRFSLILSQDYVSVSIRPKSQNSGEYIEVTAAFDDSSYESASVALFIENNTPARWDEEKVFTVQEYLDWFNSEE
jgi:hypothetical protein